MSAFINRIPLFLMFALLAVGAITDNAGWTYAAFGFGAGAFCEMLVALWVFRWSKSRLAGKNQ